MKENTDSLIQRAKHGDIGAFEKLIEFFQDAVFGTAYVIAQSFLEFRMGIRLSSRQSGFTAPSISTLV